VHYAPGEVVNVKHGVFYVDPRSGAVDGWQLPDEPVPFPIFVSPGGRYIVYGLPTPPGSRGPSWRLFDASTMSLRAPTDGPPRFSPDESRYAVPAGGGVQVIRAEDGTVERTISLGAGGSLADAAQVWLAWSPDGGSLLVGTPDPSGRDHAGRVARVDMASGAVVVVAEDVVPVTRWAPDGRRYFTNRAGYAALDAYDAATNRVAWSVTYERLGLEPPRKPDGSFSGSIILPYASADGRRVAVEVRGGPDRPFYYLYVLDAATGAVLFRVQGAHTCGQNIWSADGRWLLVGGRRGGVAGSFLVAGDGSTVRHAPARIDDLSPVDPATGGARGGSAGLAAIEVLDVPAGTVRRTVQFSGDIGWDFAHVPLWLVDGRIVVHAPHLGHGGCGEGPPDPDEIDVRVP
jgi:hypothetical protein